MRTAAEDKYNPNCPLRLCWTVTHRSAVWHNPISHSGDEKMPIKDRKQGPKSQNPIKARGKGGWQEYQFVDMRLSQTDKTKFDEWLMSSGEEISDLLNMYCENGYKFSVSYDGNNDCFIGSMTCLGETDNNYRFVLTSRNDNWYNALALCVYKTQVLCENGHWDTSYRPTNFG